MGRAPWDGMEENPLIINPINTPEKSREAHLLGPKYPLLKGSNRGEKDSSLATSHDRMADFAHMSGMENGDNDRYIKPSLKINRIWN